MGWGSETAAVAGHEWGLNTIMGTGRPPIALSMPSAGLGALDPGVDVLRHAVHGLHRHPFGPGRARDEERVDRLGGTVGAGAAEGVVELGEEHALPGLGQLTADVGRVTGEEAAHLVQGLGRDQRVLGPRVGELQVGPGRVAADGVPLELPGRPGAAW